MRSKQLLCNASGIFLKNVTALVFLSKQYVFMHRDLVSEKALRFFALSLYPLLFLLILSGCNGDEADDVIPEDVSSYDISLLSPSGNSFNTSSFTDNGRGIFLIGDTLLYVHSRNNRSVVSYKLSDKGDVSSAHYFTSFSTSEHIGSKEEGAYGHGIFIKPDDLRKMWLYNRTEIWEFNLPKAGDVSSAVYSNYMDLSQFVERGHGIYFKPDGSRLYVDDRNKAMIHQFDLQEAWSVSGISNHTNLDISKNHAAVRALTFHPNGRVMHLLDTDLRELQQYVLRTPWQIETAEFDQSTQIYLSNPRSFIWNGNGSKGYVMNTDNGTIMEYVVTPKP